MTSRQYNFYPKISELQKFEAYLVSKGFIVLKVPANNLPFKKTNELIHSQDDYWPASYITKIEFLDGIVEQFIETQNYYLIDEITSLAIEISLPEKLEDSENLQPGRVYFITGYYDKNYEWIEKNTDFVNEANKILQWCRKNFNLSFL